jgi:hypothetical protein
VPPDFLNSREDALLLWLVVIVVVALSKDGRGIGSAIPGVLRAFLLPKVSGVFLVAACRPVAVPADFPESSR